MKQMMNAPPGNCTEKEKTLWQKIQQFRLDDPEAILPFSRKLAWEQNWDYDYTLKAIEEYRKFIFLCCISPYGASPSKVIDEVWHLHLIYTQNYWEEFCDKTLERKLHHHPSSGGAQQKEKHIKWEQDTLCYYRSIFMAEPPPEYWAEDGNLSWEKNNHHQSFLQKALKYFALLPFLLLISCNGNSVAGFIILPIAIFIFGIIRTAFKFIFGIIRTAFKYDAKHYNDKKQEQDNSSSSGGSGCSSGGSGCSGGGGGCSGGCGGCGGS